MVVMSGTGVSGEKTIASASCSRPASQYLRAGVAERFFSHCERSPRTVLARIRCPHRVAATGTRYVRPLRRPLLSRTMKPVGQMPGEPNPARTAGSTKPLSVRKNCTSKPVEVSIVLRHSTAIVVSDENVPPTAPWAQYPTKYRFARKATRSVHGVRSFGQRMRARIAPPISQPPNHIAVVRSGTVPWAKGTRTIQTNIAASSPIAYSASTASASRRPRPVHGLG